jgi:hypothetical protein
MKKKKTSIPTYKGQDEETLLQQRLDETYTMKKNVPTNMASTWVPFSFWQNENFKYFCHI